MGNKHSTTPRGGPTDQPSECVQTSQTGSSNCTAAAKVKGREHPQGSGGGESQRKGPVVGDDVASSRVGEPVLTNGDYGIYSFYNPPPGTEANLDIVFFHGLQLEPWIGQDVWRDTWHTRDGTAMWPAKWLPGEFPSARIWAVSYPAKAILDPRDVQTHLETLAVSLLNQLTDPKVDIGGGQRRVVLVGHSVGGLVLKQVVVEAHNRANGDQLQQLTRRARRLLDNLGGVAFYATPHAGSLLPDWAKMIRGGSSEKSTATSEAQRNEGLTQWLKVFNESASLLQGRFQTVVTQAAVQPLCFLEQHSTQKPDGSWELVVVPGSAALNATSGCQYIQADHFNVCRPQSENDVIFSSLVDYVVVSVRSKVPPAVKPTVKGDAIAQPDWVQRVVTELQRTGAVGLHGMGGAGKSTLAKAVYDSCRNIPRFRGRVCLLQMKTGERPDVMLQKQFLKSLLLKSQPLDVSSLDDGVGQIEKALIDLRSQSGRFLLIIDNVWQQADLENLLPLDELSRNVGPDRSWLVLTSRNTAAIKVDTNIVVIPQPVLSRIQQCEALLMYASKTTTSESYQDGRDGPARPSTTNGRQQQEQEDAASSHLSHTAKRLGCSVQELYDVASQLISFCHGLPLHLRILGTQLSSKDSLEGWSRYLKDLQERRASALHLNGDRTHNSPVLSASLDDNGVWMTRSLRQAFLNIVLFFPYFPGDQYVEMLDRWCKLADEECPSDCVKQLVGRALLQIDDNNVVTVHDALREYAVQLITSSGYQDKVDWPVAFVANKVARDTATVTKLAMVNCSGEMRPPPTLQVLLLDRCYELDVQVPFKRSMRATLPSMKMLFLRDVGLKTLDTLVSSCSPTQLQALWVNIRRLRPSLKDKAPTTLEGPNSLPKSITDLTALETLNLEGFDQLQALPETFGNLTALEALNLEMCTKLQALPQSFGNLTALKTLNLWYGAQLQALPQSFGNLTALKTLNLEWCAQLQALPESFSNLTALETLNMEGCAQLQALPQSFGNLTAMKTLNLNGCDVLQALPESFGNLTALETLNLEGCAQLLTLPESFDNLTVLKTVHLKGCRKLQALPESFGNLTALEKLNLAGCAQLQALPDSFGNLKSLKTLLLMCWCAQLRALPQSFGYLTALEMLNLDGCRKLLALPEPFGNLTALETLNLKGCAQLQALPRSFGNLTSLQTLNLNGCDVLTVLPESFGNLTTLQTLNLKGCAQLQALPQSFGYLTAMQTLNLEGCAQLQALPDSFGNLTALEMLNLKGCARLPTFPESFGTLTAMETLNLEGCAQLLTLPESFGNLIALKTLVLEGCAQLLTLPESFGNLTALKTLNLERCAKLQALPESFGKLTARETLNLKGCAQLQALPESFGNLTALKTLNLEGCAQLRALPDSFGNLTALETLDLECCNLSEEAIPPLVRLLASQHGGVQQNAAKALWMLAHNEAISVTIAQTGAIPPLVRLMGSQDAGVQQNAAKALWMIARNETISVTIAHQAGAIPPLVRLLGSQDAGVQQQAAGALWMLARNETISVTIAQTGAIPPLVRLLASQHDGVQLWVAGALGNLAAFNDNNRVAIAQTGAIPPLVRLLGSQDAGLQQSAAKALWMLARNETISVTMAQAGAIPPLVRLLGSQDAGVQLWVAGALGNLAAFNDNNRVAIAQTGAIPPLVRLLGSQDAGVQQQAVGALWMLARNEIISVTIAQAGAIPPLVRLLNSQHAGVPLRVAGALGNLAAFNDANRVTIAQAGAIPHLARLLGSHDAVMKGEAARALGNLADCNDANRAAIAQAGAITSLVGLLGSNQDADVQLWAVWALCHLQYLGGSSGPPQIHSDAVVPLVRLLSRKEVGVLKVVCRTMYRLNIIPANKVAFGQAGAIPALKELLVSPDSDVREWAGKALQQLEC